MNAAEAEKILVFLMDQGLRPPESYQRPNGLRTAADGYARLLGSAGVGLAEAQDAAAAYVLDCDDSRFPTPWPSAGKLIARTPVARRLAAFGGDLDTGAAWVDFSNRLASVSRYDEPRAQAATLADPDPQRDAAMRFATAERGLTAWLNRTPDGAPHLERGWRDAYRAARRGQAADPVVARLVAHAHRQIPAEAK
jgi:hypothetical protein